MNTDGFITSSNRHPWLGKHMGDAPFRRLRESRRRGCVVVVRNATPGGADINVPRRLMVKFFRRGVESGATEPSSYGNLGAWYATSWLRFSSQHHGLESAPFPNHPYLACT